MLGAGAIVLDVKGSNPNIWKDCRIRCRLDGHWRRNSLFYLLAQNSSRVWGPGAMSLTPWSRVRTSWLQSRPGSLNIYTVFSTPWSRVPTSWSHARPGAVNTCTLSSTPWSRVPPSWSHARPGSVNICLYLELSFKDRHLKRLSFRMLKKITAFQTIIV